MAKGQRDVNQHMRPNIQISHSLNGRVKDYAAANDLSTAEAYREIIQAGLDEVEGESRAEPVTIVDRPESRERDEQDDEKDEISAVLAGWQHGRSDAEQEASRTVARAALEWLRDRDEPAKRSDVPFQQFDDPLERTDETLWTEVVRDSWQHAAEKGHITKPNSRAYEWSGRS